MNLTVIDTKKDSLEVIRQLSKPSMQYVDLIIGPVYDSEIFEVQKFCSVYNIPLILPLRYSPNVFGTDFPLINCNAVDSLQSMYIGMHAANAFKNFQVVIVEDGIKTNQVFSARNFKKGYELSSGKSCRIIDGELITPDLVWNKKDSLLLFYTNKSATSSNRAIANKSKYKSIVVGPADWLNIERVNYDVLNGLYFYDTYLVESNDSAYIRMRQTYRLKYGGDPERYTIIAYDQFSFIGNGLMAFGTDFYKNILNKEFNYTHRTFHFVQRGNMIENAGTNLFYYQDYNISKAFWRY
jgi:hypothetical protein